MEEKLTVSKEQAIAEFDAWRENCDLDFDENDLPDDQKALVDGCRRRFVKAMTGGRLVVDGEKLKYTISDKSPDGFKGREVEIKNPGARLKFAMDGFKDNQQAEREIAGMSALTGQDVGFFRKLCMTDFNFFEGVIALFMLS